jgi:hypothetical protein
VDLNLDSLKREILDYLDTAGFAVFRSSPGGLEGLPMVLWDVEHHPDYRVFLEAARKAEAKLLLFASREFESSDIDDLLEQIAEADLPRDEQHDYESRLRGLRDFEGSTCSIELAFDYNSRLYVYELQPDWYEEFLSVEDEIVARMSDEDEMDDDGGLGGYFSKN